MTLQEIRTSVEQYYNVDLNDKNREKNTIDARRAYFYISTHLYKHRVSHSGALIGLRHDTAIYHRNKGIDFVKYNYKEFIEEVFNITGIDLTVDKKKEKLSDLISKLNIKDLPLSKVNDLADRINLIIKGYNIKHGKDEHEIIISNGISSNE